MVSKGVTAFQTGWPSCEPDAGQPDSIPGNESRLQTMPFHFSSLKPVPFFRAIGEVESIMELSNHHFLIGREKHRRLEALFGGIVELGLG